jgi:hypothetical protein
VGKRPHLLSGYPPQINRMGARVPATISPTPIRHHASSHAPVYVKAVPERGVPDLQLGEQLIRIIDQEFFDGGSGELVE